jgi:hypothetical protein
MDILQITTDWVAIGIAIVVSTEGATVIVTEYGQGAGGLYVKQPFDPVVKNNVAVPVPVDALMEIVNADAPALGI